MQLLTNRRGFGGEETWLAEIEGRQTATAEQTPTEVRISKRQPSETIITSYLCQTIAKGNFHLAQHFTCAFRLLGSASPTRSHQAGDTIRRRLSQLSPHSDCGALSGHFRCPILTPTSV